MVDDAPDDMVNHINRDVDAVLYEGKYDIRTAQYFDDYCVKTGRLIDKHTGRSAVSEQYDIICSDEFRKKFFEYAAGFVKRETVYRDEVGDWGVYLYYRKE